MSNDSEPEEDSTDDDADDQGDEIVDDPEAELEGLLERAETATATAEDCAEEIKTAKDEAEKELAAIKQSIANITASTHAVTSLLPAADVAITEASAKHATIEELAVAARAAVTKLDEYVNTLKIAEVDTDDYNHQLSEWVDKFSAYEEKIKGLLPGATSTGLAFAFGTRRKAYLWPTFSWTIVFVVCIGFLIYIAWGSQEILLGGDEIAWQNALKYFLGRVVLAAPIVWLALHAAHQQALGQRLGEDYGYKETISRAFEGYKRELSELRKGKDETLASTLANDVLDILSERPGRIYDKKIESVSPAHSAAELLMSLSPSIDIIDKLKEKITDPAVRTILEEIQKSLTQLTKISR